ncbi:MAG: hypothetical protein E3K32_11865 [wastewater metagenome]|nr:hypothetical protein [Candidatus Loosdrechtia aerotolerans]
MRTCGDCLFMRAKIPVSIDGRILYRKAKASCVKGQIRNNQGNQIQFNDSQRRLMHREYNDVYIYKHWMRAASCHHYNDSDIGQLDFGSFQEEKGSGNSTPQETSSDRNF